MTEIEIIDRLCAIISMQSEMIRQQAFVISQANDFDEETERRFAERRQAINAEIAVVGNDRGLTSSLPTEE